MSEKTPSTRENRKDEHIQAVRQMPENHSTGFEDVVLVPESASEVDWDDIHLETELLGRTLASPIIINAMTGGTAQAERINARLARAARRHGLAMAVGSETAALKNLRLSSTYTVVRDENPHGIVLANVSMGTDAEHAQAAIDLIQADFLQVHWNTAQELFMHEGDRQFRGLLERLREVADHVSVPVIAKEIGQGMTGAAASRFVAFGARGIDVGGRGGTNFIAVESWRRGQIVDADWETWGLRTAESLLEVVHSVPANVAVIASGGIRSGHDVAKSLAIGATAVGIAGPLLRLAADGDDDGLHRYIEELHLTLKRLLVLVGVTRVDELQKRPVVIRGAVHDWLESRGFEDILPRLARRAAD